MPEPPNMEIRETETTTMSRQLNGDRQKAPGWNRNLKRNKIVSIKFIFLVAVSVVGHEPVWMRIQLVKWIQWIQIWIRIRIQKVKKI
jgi:hypothetical protein